MPFTCCRGASLLDDFMAGFLVDELVDELVDLLAGVPADVLVGVPVDVPVDVLGEFMAGSLGLNHYFDCRNE
jgi:hypothetical protein